MGSHTKLLADNSGKQVMFVLIKTNFAQQIFWEKKMIKSDLKPV